MTSKRDTSAFEPPADAPALDGAADPATLEGVTATLADVVCWIAFYLERCSTDEIDLDVALALQNLIVDALQRLSIPDRLAFLEHAAARANESTIGEYQVFLLDLAETMGLE